MADANLKAAAAYLRRAAQARKAEADELRRQAVRVDSEKKSKVQTMKMEEQVRQVAVYQSDGGIQRANHIRELNDLRSQEQVEEREATQNIQKLQQDAANKEGEMTGLISQASDLEKKAG